MPEPAAPSLGLSLADGILRDLVISAIGGAVVAVSGMLWRLYQRWRIERQFSLKGEYIARYDDIVDGQSVNVTRVAKITQKSATLRIKNEFEDRSWTLEGTLLPRGHVSGVYSADDTFDEGVGSFYLRVKGADLEGMWTGYDHENQKVNSGRYSFHRMIDTAIRAAAKDDVVSMLDISSSEFGSGYYGEKDIRFSSARHVALVALVSKRVVGFGLGYVAGEQELDEMFGGHQTKLPTSIVTAAETGRLGVLKSIAVARDMHNMGIGTKLFHDMEKRLRRRGALRFVVPAWKDGDDIHIEGLIRKAGYRELFEIKEFWRKDCDSGVFRCVSRETGPCRCSAVFFQDK